jgi:hypothetical protein
VSECIRRIYCAWGISLLRLFSDFQVAMFALRLGTARPERYICYLLRKRAVKHEGWEEARGESILKKRI